MRNQTMINLDGGLVWSCMWKSEGFIWLNSLTSAIPTVIAMAVIIIKTIQTRNVFEGNI